MANFPTSLPSITNPNANDTLAAVPHHTQHGTANDEIAAIAAKIGTGSSTPTVHQLLLGSGTGTSAWGTAIGSGDDLRLYSRPGNTTGQLLTLRKGTSADPDTTFSPLVKITRLMEVDESVFGVSGTDGGEELAAMVVVCEGTEAGVNQPVAVLGVAHAKGTASGATGRYPDATGGYFRGWTTGDDAVGTGIGLFAQGYSDSDLGRADGMQVAVGNDSGTDHVINSTGKGRSTGAWVCATGGNRSSVGIQVGNGFGHQFVVGFHVNGQSTASPTATVQTASVANPTVITTTAAHGLLDGDQVVISGSNSTPSIDGTYTATVTGATTFTIPVNVTVQGTAGSITGRIGAALTAAFRDDSNAVYGLQVRGNHTAAIVTQEATGSALWMGNGQSKGIIATNNAGSGTLTVLYMNTSDALILGGSTVSNVQVATDLFLSGKNIVTDTSTGMKIGTSTSQKLGFFNATPIAKPTGVAVSAAGIHAALVSLGLIAA